MEVYFQLQLILRNGAVNESKVLRNDLVKDETSYSRLDDTGLYCAVGHGAAYPYLYPAVESNHMVLVSQDGLVYALENAALTRRSRSLLGQVVNTKNHILGRNCHRAAVRRL